MFSFHLPFISLLLPFFMWGTSTPTTTLITPVIGTGTSVQSSVSVTSIPSPSGETVIEIKTPATSTKKIIHAPKGVKQVYYSENINGVEHSYATTTPINDDDIVEMRNDARALNDRIQRMVERQQAMFDEQKKIFDDLQD